MDQDTSLLAVPTHQRASLAVSGKAEWSTATITSERGHSHSMSPL
jgi:hypothetical protein